MLKRILLAIFKINLHIAVAAIQLSVLVGMISLVPYFTKKVHQMYIREYVGSKVVMITSDNPDKTKFYGGGTGFHVIAPSGKVYIATNHHICEDGKDGKIWVGIRGQTKFVQRKIIEMSDFTDLCLIEPLSGVSGLRVDDEPKVGDYIAAVGHPNLQPKTLTEGEVQGRDAMEFTSGIVGKDGFTKKNCNKKNEILIEYKLTDEDKKQVDKKNNEDRNYTDKNDEFYRSLRSTGIAHICIARFMSLVTTTGGYHGSSGSPMVDYYGNVVGVLFAVMEDRVWARGITVTDLKKFLRKR